MLNVKSSALALWSQSEEKKKSLVGFDIVMVIPSHSIWQVTSELSLNWGKILPDGHTCTHPVSPTAGVKQGGGWGGRVSGDARLGCEVQVSGTKELQRCQRLEQCCAA